MRQRYLVNPFFDKSWRSRPCDLAIYKYHHSLAESTITPLHVLPRLAARLGVKNIYVKDESHRFGLNAFKVLGVSWAVHQMISR